MDDTFPDVKSVFGRAMEIDSSAERAAYLDQACGDNAALRAEVEALLGALVQAAGFMQQPAAVPTGVFAASDFAERSGMTIGPYRLMEEIGAGGMGLVFVAEQQEPVRRKVALKVIKPGMDTREVIARFEQERQTLALMDHPNIAMVFDGGATAAGRPFFVMELVRGVPITTFCDESALTPRQRLELFLPICQAVQHAHLKAIIHRDLKPSNILVSSHDGVPVPKIIDFGVAKAVGDRLTEKTIYTRLTQMVGTPLYMSPEQAGMSGLDIDTRTDIYSLGVLLYELLTGTTPFDQRRLKKAGFDEIRRIIREEEPPKPSTRLSELSKTGDPNTTGVAKDTDQQTEVASLATISARRHTEPAKLSKLLRGDLDWIVMKCLEKDRTRRYQTAQELAMDLQRYLGDEPVLACSPSAAYRFRKFARRNKPGLALAALVLFFLVLLGGGVGWSVRDRAARHAKVAGQVESNLAEVDRLEGEQKWPEALSAVRRAEAAAASGEADAATTERVRQRLKDLEFIDRLEQIRAQRAMLVVDGNFDDAGANREYARAFRDHGVDVDELAVETSIDRLKARPALAIPLAAALDEWSMARSQVFEGDPAKWRRLVSVARGIDPDPLRDRLRSAREQPGSVARDALRRMAESIDVRAHPPTTLFSLAWTLQRVNHSESALRLLRDAQYAYPGDFWLNLSLGSIALVKQKDYERAVRYCTAAVSIRPHSAAAHYNLGTALHEQKKLDEAIACYRKAIDLDVNFAYAHNNLGLALYHQNKLDEAVRHYRKAIDLDPKFAKPHHNLGIALMDQGKPDAAIAAYRKAIDLGANLAAAHNNLGNALSRKNKLDEAGRHLRKAIQIDPNYAVAHNNLGTVLRKQKRLDDAIAAYCKAIDLDPKFAAAHNNLGTALREQGRLDKAIAAYRKAIELDPKFAGAYSNLGALLCDELKDYDKAIDCFQKAIEIDPTYTNARGNLGVALAKKGWHLISSPDSKLRDPKRAIEALKEAAQLVPQSALAWQYLGWAQYQAGNWNASIEALEKSCRLQHGGTGDSGQWIVQALAHAKLAAQEGLPEKERAHHQAEARRRYEAADKQIDSMWRVRPGDATSQTIWDFRTEARELIGAKEKKK